MESSGHPRPGWGRGGNRVGVTRGYPVRRHRALHNQGSRFQGVRRQRVQRGTHQERFGFLRV